MAKRRAHGEGTIVKLGDGAWRGAVVLEGGTRKWVRGATRSEVVRKLTELKSRRDQGLPAVSGDVLLESYLDQWLDEAVRPSVRPRTFDSYRLHVDRHINPALGRITLAALRPAHVQRMISDLQDSGLAPATVRRIHSTLRRALGQAERWELVPRNVARLVDLPKAEVREIEPLTIDEARTFLESIRGDRLEALYSVAIGLGLRQGEALGLRWCDADLDRRELWVRYQLQRNARGPGLIKLGEYKAGLVPVKTSRSRRALVMPPTVTEQLARHRARQGREQLLSAGGWHRFDLVFCTTTGSPLNPNRMTKRLQAHLRSAGLEPRRFHDLRHSCGTILAAQGVPLGDIQSILGHANIGVTMRYVHLLPEAQERAAQRMDDALWGSGSG